ncbi:major facilitator superfamily domain-containing protein [Helicostylum pulchrum]|nr:major facilitator superfamily domain-containing protein [Helicostylum pulchrum]
MIENKKTLILSFIAALAVANVSGPQYVYPTYGTSLADKFGWNGIENSMVSTATFVGVSFSGPLNAWLVENLGIKNTLRIASFSAFTGLFLLAQTYAGYLSSHYMLCSIYLACTGFAGAASYICSLDSQAHNFKSHRGMSMGLTSASLGMSGLVFSQINDKYFKAAPDEQDNSTFDFLLFIGCIISVISFLGSFVLGPLQRDEIVVDLSTDLMIQDEVVTQNLNQHRYAESISSFSTSSTRFEEEEEEEESRPLLSKNVVPSADNVLLIKKMAYHQQQQQLQKEEEEPTVSGIAFFLDPVGYSLALSLLVVLGLGYVYLANIGQLLTTLSPPDISVSDAQHLRNLHVSMFSIANCGSRAVFGTLSDILQRKAGVHRLWFFWSATVGVVISMVYLVTCVSNTDQLMISTITIAITYGISFGVAPATISEFGTKVNFILFILQKKKKLIYLYLFILKGICSQLGYFIMCSRYRQSIIQCLVWYILRTRVKETRWCWYLLWLCLLRNYLFSRHRCCIHLYIYIIAGDI